jgi:hypothetical protein
MSKNTIRTDKTCLNCHHVVEKRFCPNCGQENTDTRKTFFLLIVHFFEDLTHYENSFWKTIKNLIFRPASLTKEYLSGKRMSYLAPIRLYIFISFITFFLIGYFPNSGESLVNINQTQTSETTENGKTKIDTLVAKKLSVSEFIDYQKKEDAIKKLDSKNKIEERGFDTGFNSLKELDSIQKFGKPNEKLDDLEYWLLRKIQIVNDKYSDSEILEKFIESAGHNFPKVLLIYMPIFAFLLWVFQSKKRWYYFDHAIFTLHYFSFLLLIVLANFLFAKLLSLFGGIDFIENIFKTVAYLWMFYYFFPAHHRFYGETKLTSFFKSISLFVINMIFIVIILLIYFIYTLINIH